MTLAEFLQNFTLPLFPTLTRIAVIIAVLAGLYLMRNWERDKRENIFCFSALLLWVAWHGGIAIAAVLTYLFRGEPLPYDWFRTTYHTTFYVFGVLTMLIAVVSALPSLWKTRRKEPFFLLFGGLLLWSCISFLHAGCYEEQWQGTDYMLGGLLSYVIYAGVLLCAYRLQKGKLFLLRLFALAANLQAVLILFQTFDAPWALECMVSSGAGTYFNTNHCAYYLTMAILSLLGLYLHDGGEKRRWLYLLSIGLQYYALLRNETLGGVLAVWGGLVVVYVLYCVRCHRSWRDFLPCALLIAISCTCTSFLTLELKKLLTGVSEIAEDPNSEEAAEAGSSRFGLWKATIEFIGQKPLFGWGPEGVASKLSDMAGWDRTHNEYLEYAVSVGIPGLCLYLAGLVALCVERLKRLAKLDAVTVIAGGAVVGYLFSAMFGVTMYQTTPLYFLLLGLVASENGKERETALCSTQTPV